MSGQSRSRRRAPTAPAPQPARPELAGAVDNSVMLARMRESRRGGGDPDEVEQDGPDMVFELGGDGETVVVDDGPQVTTEPTADQSAAQERLAALDDPGLDAEQRVISAANSRAVLEDSLLGLNHVDTPQREQILARVEGLEGAALVQEMRTIESALSGPNADRAMSTLADIETLRAERPREASRLSPDVVSMLVGGVADARSESARGQEGVMGRSHARHAATTLLDMNGDNYLGVRAMLAEAGGGEGSDAATEQALILAAVAARQDTLTTDDEEDVWQMVGGETDATHEMEHLSDFAADIRGMDREELVRTTTLLDVHDANTSPVDPNNLAGPADAVGDNDGLYQRFTHSCGPTTAQVVQGELDPVYALAAHERGLDDPATDSMTAIEQQVVLELGEGEAVSRAAAQARRPVIEGLRTSVTPVLDGLAESGDLSQEQRRDFTRFLGDPDQLDDDQREAAEARLAEVRDATDGHPTDAEIETLRAGSGGSGMVAEDALDMVTGTPHDVTGVDLGDDLSDLDDVSTRLRDGEDVPIRIEYENEEGHFMNVTDVRTNDEGSRSFLVADPWTGAHRWVSEGDFTREGGVSEVFGLGSAHVSDVYTRQDETP